MRSPILVRALRAILAGRYFACLAALVFLVGLPAQSQLSVPITVQEALYPGAPTQGITRTQDPVTVGIPLSDTANIHDVTQLGLSGASAGQFRTLGRWPSGNVKWVLVDTQADVIAGVQNTSIVLTTGSGNFGGANLATDNGNSISVNTGGAQFVIRKKNFNLFDQVVVNGKTLVASNTSTGLVLMGPAGGQVSCGVCTNAYTSSNDPNSTAVVEENGPVRAAIKVDGSHVDALGNVYMHYTVRMQFFRGKTFAKVEVILRNADETNNLAGDFNSAYKGFASYEARVTTALGGGRAFNIGTDSSNSASGLFAGSEDAYLYQAYSNNGEVEDWNAPNCLATAQATQRCVVSYIARTPVTGGGFTYAQDGYQIVHGTNVLASGDHTKYPQGWADLTDGSGAGVEIGVYQLSGYWPKSLQLKSGGSEVRVGIWPSQSLFTKGGGQPYYQAWPTYSVHDLFFNFHGSALTSASDSFLAFQHHLLGRAPISQYNNAGVFYYPLLDPAKEDTYYKSINVPCCLQDKAPRIFRRYGWANAGGGNQHEMRWSYLRNFLERGMPGRYLFAANFYRLVTEHSFPRSDGFSWRDHPLSQLDYLGFPTIASANFAMAHRDFIDGEHSHWYGMTDYYFLTGDEAVKDQILDGVKNGLLNPNTVTNQGKMWDTRDVGERAMGDARLYSALMAFGDPDALKIAPLVNTFLGAQVFAPMKVSGFGTAVQGTSYPRGVQWGCCQTDTEPPHFSGRAVGTFHEAILEEGLYELAQSLGPSWSGYQQALDLAYGEAQWSLTEGYGSASNAVPTPLNSGFRYLVFIDEANAGLKYFELPGGGETNWFHFYIPAAYAGDTSWKQKFEWYMQRLAANSGTDWAEYGSHMVQSVVDKVINPPAFQLSTVPSLTVVNNGGGSYTLSWIVPSNTSSYRIKYTAQKNIVDWIGFDPGANKFIVDPTSTWPWFASNEVPNPPIPQSAGSLQKVTITGLDPSQSFHFAVKAYIGGGQGGDHTPPSVTVISPAQNANVSGSITLSAKATDNVAVAWVAFAVDGNRVGSPIVNPPYSVPWNSSTVVNGAHTITATASDLSGNLANSSIPITVTNAVDRTPPTVAITAPALGSQLSGTVMVSASASDNVGVAWVAFQVDGQPLGTQITAPPYSQAFATNNVANGTHVIKATASDFAGNQASTTVTVSVNNSSQTPQLTIVAPQANSQVSGTITVSASTSNVSSVAMVSFAVDSTLIGTLSGNNLQPPYNYAWDTTRVANGTHNVSVTVCRSPATYAQQQPQQQPVMSARALTLEESLSDGREYVARVPGAPQPRPNLLNISYRSPTLIATSTATSSRIAACTSTLAKSESVMVSNSGGNQPPKVTVTAPAPGKVSGKVTLAATVTAQNPISTVAFQVDQQTVSTVTSPPYQVSLDTTKYTDGNHVFGVVATESKNNVGSGSVTVTVANQVDKQPPSVTLTAPTNGAKITGTFVLTATATDNVGVGKVQFLVDGGYVSPAITHAPYQFSWDSSQVSNGTHVVTAQAWDLANNTAKSTSVTITTSNTVSQNVWQAVNYTADGTFAFRGWNQVVYDPVQQKVLAWFAVSGCDDPWSNSIWAYDTATANFSRESWSGGGALINQQCVSPVFVPDPPNHPGDRHPYHQMAYDTNRGRMWAYSGLSDRLKCRGGLPGNCDYVDTWYFDSLSHTWTCTDTGGGCNNNTSTMVNPGVRGEGAMIFDPVNDVLVLFGGLQSGDKMNDTWHYYPATNTWKQIYPNGVQGMPVGRNGQSMVYDTVDHKIVMFGGTTGLDTNLTFLNDVWIYDAAAKTWTNPKPAVAPPGAKFPPLAYDSKRNQVVFYAGPGSAWAYSVSNNTWTQLSITGGPAITIANSVSMAYDESTDTYVLVNAVGQQVFKLRLK